MSEMVERVARAICAENEIDPDKERRIPDIDRVVYEWEIFKFTARAAIEAMRGPTYEMLSKGENAAHDAVCVYEEGIEFRISVNGALLAHDAWQAMIDEALK